MEAVTASLVLLLVPSVQDQPPLVLLVRQITHYHPMSALAQLVSSLMEVGIASRVPPHVAHAPLQLLHVRDAKLTSL